MKRLVLILGILLLTVNSYASQITFDSTATLTRSWLNSTFYKVYNLLNSGIGTDNIGSGAVTSLDISTPANPLVRDNENIGEYVYSGLTISGTALAATISAGVAYIENDADGTLHRVVTSATAKTFTDSATTWVYLDYTGAFKYTEQVSQPSTPDNNMLICKVVASTTITVTDYAQRTPANLRIYSDYIYGCAVSRDSVTATKVTIGSGEVEFGTTGKVRRNTSQISVDISTAGMGGLQTGLTAAASTFYYIYVAPDSSNTTNFKGVASNVATGTTETTDEKLIGWCYTQASNIISPDAVGANKAINNSAPNIVSISWDTISVSSSSFTSIGSAKFYSSGRPVGITYTESYSVGGAMSNNIQLLDGTTELKTVFFNEQAVSNMACAFVNWYGALSVGEHTINVKCVADGNTKTVNPGRELTIIEY